MKESSLYIRWNALLTAFEDINPDVTQALPEVRVRTAVHITEVIDRLRDRITHAGTLSFSEFSQAPVDAPTKKEQKVYAVVSFLALLEMVKNGALRAAQQDTFDDVVMSSS